MSLIGPRLRAVRGSISMEAQSVREKGERRGGVLDAGDMMCREGPLRDIGGVEMEGWMYTLGLRKRRSIV